MTFQNEIPVKTDTEKSESLTEKASKLTDTRSGQSKTNCWIHFSIAVVVFVVVTTIITITLVVTRNKTVASIIPTRAAMPHEDHHSPFRVMSYNIRLDTTQDGINQWNRRKDRVASLIRYHGVDLFGVQEALPNQMADLKMALPDFDWYGAGRDDGKNKGEFSAIFYRSDRFELLNKNTFWLSETPEIPGSKGWDADVTRVCSWVKLLDRWNFQTLYHFNTHLDHIGKVARRKSACLIMARIQNITKLNAPVILTGDFNTGPNSDPYRAIVINSTLQDAKHLTIIPHYGPNSTWSTFFVGLPLGDRIDYIFVTPYYLKTLQHAILTDSNSQYYPSDHLPVLAELRVINMAKLN